MGLVEPTCRRYWNSRSTSTFTSTSVCIDVENVCVGTVGGLAGFAFLAARASVKAEAGSAERSSVALSRGRGRAPDCSFFVKGWIEEDEDEEDGCVSTSCVSTSIASIAASPSPCP